MTMQLGRQKNFPTTALRREGSANTLRLRVLMEEQQRVEIGQRIRELREASPYTNESIAEHVGVGVRAVANWISGTTGITYANAKKVAELFEVDIRWLWDGVERPKDNDLMGALSGADQLSRIERKLDSLLAWAEGRTAEEVEADLVPGEGQEPQPSEQSGD